MSALVRSLNDKLHLPTRARSDYHTLICTSMLIQAIHSYVWQGTSGTSRDVPAVGLESLSGLKICCEKNFEGRKKRDRKRERERERERDR